MAAAALSVSIVSVSAVSAVPAAADSVRSGQWYFQSLDVDAAQKISRGDGVVVAVVDSGVWAGHPDLKDAVLPGFDTAPLRPGDGRDDPSGHGTSMAGLIAGRGHGGSDGVLGIAPGSEVLPLKTPLEQFAAASETASAITWGSAHGAKVMNLAYGTVDSQSLRQAVAAAQAADVVMIASSGNLPEKERVYPGAYSEVLTVGAVDRTGAVADFSVTGPQVDLVAPGVDITSPYLEAKGGYFTGYGTSQATAIVSGAAALVRAKFPHLSAAEVIHRLEATAIDKGLPGRDDQYGYGVLNIMGALTADVAPLQPSAASTGGPDAGPPVVQPPGDKSSTGTLLWIGGGIAGLLLIGLVIAVIVLSRRSTPGRY